MVRLHLALLALVAGSAAGVLFVGDARADAAVVPPAPVDSPPVEPIASKPDWEFELGGKVAYLSPPIRGGTSPFGAGFGGRAGFAFSQVYVGLSVVDYLGSKDVDVTDTSLLYGAELGYGFRLVRVNGNVLTLRPQIGAGGISVFRTDPSTTTSTGRTSTGRRGRADVVSSASGGRGNVTTVDAFYVEPAVTLMFSSGVFFVAINGNLVVVPGIAYSGAEAATWLTYGTQGQTGLRF
jgi:hypothetical protein